MTIKEVEQKTGLPRSVIRFYEKEGLIAPQRNAQNSYREYTQADVDRLIRIAFLRTMDISIEDIRRVIAGDLALGEAAGERYRVLCMQEKELARAMHICTQLKSDAPTDFDALDVSSYTGEMKDYVTEYRSVLLQDCTRFALWFAQDGCWQILVLVGTLLAAIMFPKLPDSIPIQWDAGAVTSTAPRGAIFAYPIAMLVIRFVLGGRIRAVCQHYMGEWGERIAPYAVNGLCFLALCLEAFTVLYLFGAARFVEAAILFAGLLVLALACLALRFGGKNRADT